MPTGALALPLHVGRWKRGFHFFPPLFCFSGASKFLTPGFLPCFFSRLTYWTFPPSDFCLCSRLSPPEVGHSHDLITIHTSVAVCYFTWLTLLLMRSVPAPFHSVCSQSPPPFVRWCSVFPALLLPFLISFMLGRFWLLVCQRHRCGIACGAVIIRSLTGALLARRTFGLIGPIARTPLAVPFWADLHWNAFLPLCATSAPTADIPCSGPALSFCFGLSHLVPSHGPRDGSAFPSISPG